MAVPIVLIPEGTRVRVRRAQLPQDPRLTGKPGTVVAASEYYPNRIGVALDGDAELRFFLPAELEVVEALPLPPEREQAKRLRALP